MPKFESDRIVPHSPEKMFALVADVESYPEFVPMCEALTIRSKREKQGKVLLIADMTVGYMAINETFTSQVLLNPEESRIEVSYIDGPFRHLHNRWQFEPADGGCNVNFFIDYEFKSMTLALLMGAVFDRAFHMFSDAFAKRADKIYGTGKIV